MIFSFALTCTLLCLAHGLRVGDVNPERKSPLAWDKDGVPPPSADKGDFVKVCEGVDLHDIQIPSGECEKLKTMRKMEKMSQCTANATMFELNSYLLLRDAISGHNTVHVWEQSGCGKCSAFNYINWWGCSANVFLPSTQTALAQVVSRHDDVCNATHLLHTRCKYGCAKCAWSVAEGLVSQSNEVQLGQWVIGDIKKDEEWPKPDDDEVKRDEVWILLTVVWYTFFVDGLVILLSYNDKRPTSFMRFWQGIVALVAIVIQLTFMSVYGYAGAVLLALAWVSTYSRYGLRVGVGVVVILTIAVKITACVVVVWSTQYADALLYFCVLLYLTAMFYMIAYHHHNFDAFMLCAFTYGALSVANLSIVLDDAGYASPVVSKMIGATMYSILPVGRWFGTFSGVTVARAADIATHHGSIVFIRNLSPIMGEMIVFVFVILVCITVAVSYRVVCGWPYTKHSPSIPLFNRVFTAFSLGLSGYEHMFMIFRVADSRKDPKAYFAVLMVAGQIGAILFAHEIMWISFIFFAYRVFFESNFRFIKSALALNEVREVTAIRTKFTAFGSTGSLAFEGLMDMMRSSTTVAYKNAGQTVKASALVARSCGNLVIRTVGHVVSAHSKSLTVALKASPFDVDPEYLDVRYDPSALDEYIVNDWVVTLHSNSSFDAPPAFPDLTWYERFNVEQVVLCKPMNNDFELLKKGQFDFEETCIRIAAEVDYGDSGSPVFAIMEDGATKYAGAIVAGTLDSAPNWVTPVYAAAPIGMKDARNVQLRVKDNNNGRSAAVVAAAQSAARVVLANRVIITTDTAAEGRRTAMVGTATKALRAVGVSEQHVASLKCLLLEGKASDHAIRSYIPEWVIKGHSPPAATEAGAVDELIVDMGG